MRDRTDANRPYQLAAHGQDALLGASAQPCRGKADSAWRDRQLSSPSKPSYSLSRCL